MPILGTAQILGDAKGTPWSKFGEDLSDTELTILSNADNKLPNVQARGGRFKSMRFKILNHLFKSRFKSIEFCQKTTDLNRTYFHIFQFILYCKASYI